MSALLDGDDLELRDPSWCEGVHVPWTDGKCLYCGTTVGLKTIAEQRRAKAEEAAILDLTRRGIELADHPKTAQEISAELAIAAVILRDDPEAMITGMATSPPGLYRVTITEHPDLHGFMWAFWTSDGTTKRGVARTRYRALRALVAERKAWRAAGWGMWGDEARQLRRRRRRIKAKRAQVQFRKDHPRGTVVWEGESELDGAPIVLIATGIRQRPEGARNTKLGDAVQTWILRRDMAPIAAFAAKADVSVCGTCPLRPRGEGLSDRACFVQPGFLEQLFLAYRRGSYPPVENLVGPGAGFMFPPTWTRLMRIGSFGDPAAVPSAVWTWLANPDAGWLGYTHAWRNPKNRWLRDLLMASVDSPAERTEAKRRGWRTYRTRLPIEPVLAGEVICPASREGGRRTTCAECGLCNGSRYEPVDPRADVVNIAHGWMPTIAAYCSYRGMDLHAAGYETHNGKARPSLRVIEG